MRAHYLKTTLALDALKRWAAIAGVAAFASTGVYCSSTPSAIRGTEGATSSSGVSGNAAVATTGTSEELPGVSGETSGAGSSGPRGGATGSVTGGAQSGGSGDPSGGVSGLGSAASGNDVVGVGAGNTSGVGLLDGGPVVTGATIANGPWTMVDATQVKLLSGSPFYDRQLTQRTGYGASWDPDTLLYLYRKMANLPQASGVTAGYAGWDSTTLKGQMAGHYLSAASRWAAGGDTTFTTKVNYLVTELGKVQTALGGNLTAFASNDSAIGAPWYVHHKVLAGLVDAYIYVGNQQALSIAEKYAAYINTQLGSSSYAGNSELGGMTDVLTQMYEITNDKTYLTLATKFEPSDFISSLSQNVDQLKGQHGNMHIAFIQGEARYANATGDATATSASQNFWQIVTAHHSYVNGGNTVHEWFDGPNVEAAMLPYSTTEACNSNNMLKITSRLMERKPTPALGDYFERTLYNHILSVVAPDTGRVTYFLPMHGDFRTYLDGTFCCVGTGIESTGRYNEGIYFKNGSQLIVNLYIPSTLNWSEQGIVLQQQDFVPLTNTVTFTVTQATPPAAATIQFRIPQWVSGPVSVTVNGQAETTNAAADSYFSVSHTWQTGDVVKLTLPATLRIERAKDQSNMIAIFYGPLALAGELGTAGMPTDVASSQDAYKAVTPATVPDIVNASSSPATWLTMTDPTTLTFKMQTSAGPASGVTLAPLYSVHHQRYTVYWNLRAN